MTTNQTIVGVPRSYDAEAAARKLADCMDYPWDQMPEKGRDSMREHARAIVSAALSGNAEQPAPVAAKSRCQSCHGSGYLKDAEGLDNGYCEPCNGSGKAPVAVSIDDNVEFEKWWMSTPILRKQKIQIAQEAWFARANLSK